MDIRYGEWLPGRGLEGIVTAYWEVAGDASKISSPAVLPDGHVELVFNLGDCVALRGPAYTGDQPDRAVVGPLSRAVRLTYGERVRMFGIRFHPARGAAFLGQSGSALVDRLAPLVEICAPLDRALSPLLSGNEELGSDAGRTELDRLLLDHLPHALPPDPTVIALVNRLTSGDAAPRVSEIAREAGLSHRQLQRRFVTAVGIPPKRFVRVVRFARTWQIASMSPPEAWADLAAAHGYADQAHMVREFRAFGAAPPTRLFPDDWYDTTVMAPVRGVSKDVRSVQDRDRTPRP